jgi:NAD-dependent deacetylase
MVYFNWQILKEDALMDDKINKVAAMIAAAKRIVIFTGAGVSTESGIPDFRSPGGLWTRFDPDDFTIDKFLSSGETRKKMWKILLEGGLMADAQPNAAHYAIAELEKMGKLSSVITQNVDNLHQKAGNSPALVHELHGNMQWLLCLDCGEKYPVEIMIQNSPSEDYVPECRNCGGILKPDVIFFGEALPQKVLTQATYKSQLCDLFIVIGSSLVVYPAAYMPQYAKRARAGVVIINIGPTQQDDLADVIINHSAGETMTKIMQRLKA